MKRSAPGDVTLALHGGAGVVARAMMNQRREQRCREALTAALHEGYAVLEAGGSSLDAVVAAVTVLEDSPLFNAGHGAVFNAAGGHELDAGVMDGATGRAGAVAAVSRIKNPVQAARAVMERTQHVLLAGKGAELFARETGLRMVAPSYFSTEERAQALARARSGRAASAAERHGTVGAVALDAAGNLAAATSTGGYTGKRVGRVGDSPLVGAGLYAENETCAASATGTGEYFIRSVVCHDVAARMRYLGESVAQAARRALAGAVARGGDGGLIALDRAGNVAMPFVSEGMYRGWARSRRFSIALYR